MPEAADEKAKLRGELLAALAYFDLFDYPLTAPELRRWRWGGSGGAPALSDTLAALDDPAVGESGGYYFLAGRQGNVGVRQRRYRLAERKFRLARRFARWASLLPSVRLIAVCNSLALSNADRDSDIDLFLVCRPGTLWATRLFIVGVLKLLGLRPTRDRHADRFCLSFFLSESALDISRLALPDGDVYLPYWVATLVPVFDAGGVMDRFLDANAWIRRDLPGAGGREMGRRRDLAAARARGRALLAFLRAADAPARRLQISRLPEAVARLANLDSRVVVSDDILKFHVTDRREAYQRLFLERRIALGL